MSDENPRDFVRALARGLAVIESFEDAQSSASLSEIAARAKLSRGTVRRALITLQSLGYLAEENGRFSLLPRTLRLGYSYLSSQPLWALARPYVEEVHAQTGETTSLSVLDEGMIVYVIRINASRLMHPTLTIGSRLPAYPASMGRVLLAGLPEADLERYLRKTEFKQLTPLTVIDPARLRVLIAQARESGYAVNDQEMELGLRSIAVPITTRDGMVVAALNIACSSVRISYVEMERNSFRFCARPQARFRSCLGIPGSRHGKKAQLRRGPLVAKRGFQGRQKGAAALRPPHRGLGVTKEDRGLISDLEIRQIVALVEALDRSSFDTLQLDVGHFRLTLAKAGPAPNCRPLHRQSQFHCRLPPLVLRLLKRHPAAAAPIPASNARAAATQPGEAAPADTIDVRSPIMGLFYSSPDPHRHRLFPLVPKWMRAPQSVSSR